MVCGCDIGKSAATGMSWKNEMDRAGSPLGPSPRPDGRPSPAPGGWRKRFLDSPNTAKDSIVLFTADSVGRCSESSAIASFSPERAATIEKIATNVQTKRQLITA
jgi:hypothetical protein